MFEDDRMNNLSSLKDLKELKLLNCSFTEDGFEHILSRPVGLKKLTLRGPNYFEPSDRDSRQEFIDFGPILNAFQGHSLEVLDLDIYWGTFFDMDLIELSCLKSPTVTPYTILGLDPERIPEFKTILPLSLEKLIVRHEEGESLVLSNLYDSLKDGLPNLHLITVQISDIIEAKDNSTSPEVWIEVESWMDRFANLDVTLEVVRTPYPMTVPEFDVCSCEVLEVYH